MVTAGQPWVGSCGSGGTGGDRCDSGWLSGSALPVVTMLEPRPLRSFQQRKGVQQQLARVSTS